MSAVFCTHILQEVLGDLGGLPGARLSLDDQDLVLVDGGQQVFSVGEDGEAASDLLHGLFLQLRLRQRRSLLLLKEATIRRGVRVFTWDTLTGRSASIRPSSNVFLTFRSKE